MNYITLRAVKRAQFPSVKEPVGLSRSDGKRPDGATLISWMLGKPSAWDISIADTYYANSYIGDTATRVAAAADGAASIKMAKYIKLAKTHHFTQVKIETGGFWNDLATEVVTELGRRITVMNKSQERTS